MQSPVPIPEVSSRSRRSSTVLQSSLDLVFSYSRSQQIRYGQEVGSAPSFINPSSTSQSDGSAKSRRRWSSFDEDAAEEGEEEEEGDGNDYEAIGSSGALGLIGATEYEDLEASVSTLKPARLDSQAKTTFSPTYSPVSGQHGRQDNAIGEAGPSRPTLPGRTSAPAALSDRRVSQSMRDSDERTPLIPPDNSWRKPSDASRRFSTASRTRRGSTRSRRKSVVLMEWGKSTDGQTLFNAVAVLVGIGLLSLPLAFAYAGWIGGTAMLVGFAALTCHTAKLLARLIRADPDLRGYTDIGKKAFGSWAGGVINILFCLELFALGVALIVLFGDSLNVIYPQVSADTFKLIGFFIVLPTALLPLSLLSLPSLLSTLSSFLLITIILIDGLSKPTSPGSLRHPEPTSWSPEWEGGNWLGGIGLILAGFGGHAVMPSLARDMRRPEGFDRVINRAFAIATAISFVAGAAGYLMIGQSVSDEITRDLMQPKYAYPRWLNLFALWMIVINPVTKFGLCSRPLNLTLETLLCISEGPPPIPGAKSSSDCNLRPTTAGTDLQGSTLHTSVEDMAEEDGEEIFDRYESVERKKLCARILSRTGVTAMITAAAIYLPGFGRVMAFLGSFSAFLICIILPLLFYLFLASRLGISPSSSGKLTRERLIHWVLVFLSTGLMVAGTVWAFIPRSGHGGSGD